MEKVVLAVMETDVETIRGIGVFCCSSMGAVET